MGVCAIKRCAFGRRQTGPDGFRLRLQEKNSADAGRRDRRQGGFSLLEVLIAMVLLTVALLALLQALAAASQSLALARQKWESSMERWNQSQQIRSGGGQILDQWIVVPGSRPVSKFKVSSEKGAGNLTWEVLRAEK